MGEKIDSLQEPFLASIFTISSHHPFVVPKEREDSLPEGKTLIQPCAAYLDGSLRQFFDQNRDKEWFNSTIFAFVADHVSCEHYAERTNCSPGDFHVIGLLYTPDGSLGGCSDSPASQIDIMPTLLGILGYDQSYFAYGRDLFEPQSRPVTVVYDNGVYKAFTEKHIHIFSDGAVREIYDIADIKRTQNLVQSAYDKEIESYIKAYIQQYYEHAERKSYIVPAHLPTDK